MNQKEAESIAYEIYKLLDGEINGPGQAAVVANMAIDMCNNLLNEHPKINEKYDWWKEGLT